MSCSGGACVSPGVTVTLAPGSHGDPYSGAGAGFGPAPITTQRDALSYARYNVSQYRRKLRAEYRTKKREQAREKKQARSKARKQARARVRAKSKLGAELLRLLQLLRLPRIHFYHFFRTSEFTTCFREL